MEMICIERETNEIIYLKRFHGKVVVYESKEMERTRLRFATRMDRINWLKSRYVVIGYV